MSDAEIETALVSQINEAFRVLLNSNIQRIETFNVTGYKMGLNMIRLDIKTAD